MLLRCYYAFVLPILEYCYPVWGYAVRCHLQLLESQVYSVARLCPDQTFLSLCHRRHVAALFMLYKLIRTRIIVCLVSVHLLLSEFDIPRCRCSSSIRVRSIKVYYLYSKDMASVKLHCNGSIVTYQTVNILSPGTRLTHLYLT